MPYANDIQWLSDVRATEIVSNFSHDGMTAYDPSYTVYGEIIARGYSIPQDAISGWMGSSGHKYWILHNDVKSVATSCYYDANTDKYHWVAVFKK